MEVARIKGATHDFGKPKDWVEERDGLCGSLPVRVEPHGAELLACKSAWRPTAQELEMLNAGGFVILSCVGGQPPVMLTVEAEGAE